MRALKSQLRSSIPAIAWRDKRLREQDDEIFALKASAQDQAATADAMSEAIQRLKKRLDQVPADDKPSFRRQLIDWRHENFAGLRQDKDGWTPQRRIPRKLRNFQLAASHGVATPQVYRVWESIEEISFDDLPENFVIKSDGGAGGHGVFIVTRVGEDQYRINGDEHVVTHAGFIDYLGARPARNMRPPFYAEAAITVHNQVGDIPTDVKIYASYGRILIVMVRQISHPTSPNTWRYRFFDANGNEITEPGGKFTIDSSIPAPVQLDQMLADARHLSRAVGLPFCRVDLYDAIGDPLLGEITRTPGGAQRFSRELDQGMGAAWLRGSVNLDIDLARGRPYGILHGNHDALNLYPANHISRAENPGSWTVTTVDCATWCHPA